jgi:hypothetical protein
LFLPESLSVNEVLSVQEMLQCEKGKQCMFDEVYQDTDGATPGDIYDLEKSIGRQDVSINPTSNKD